MSWTEITRIKYRRDGLRYASDTTDEEWTLIEPRMPAKFRVGRPRETRMRAVHYRRRDLHSNRMRIDDA